MTKKQIIALLKDLLNEIDYDIYEYTDGTGAKSYFVYEEGSGEERGRTRPGTPD